ncbi:MAG: hypothetical protein QOJ06_2640 [Pseudonocardiales bacterium]|jgi:hypothetical protein|nr:hypothetical protein [Pseudonocardiales bacterium]
MNHPSRIVRAAGQPIHQCSARAINSLDTETSLRRLGGDFFQVLNAVLKIAGSAIKKDPEVRLRKTPTAYKKIARVATINATTTTLKAIEVISHLSQPASEAALTAA